jgi:hypothetical protein
VAGTSDGIRLKIAKEEVQDLPPVDIDHPDLARCAPEESEEGAVPVLRSRILKISLQNEWCFHLSAGEIARKGLTARWAPTRACGGVSLWQNLKS